MQGRGVPAPTRFPVATTPMPTRPACEKQLVTGFLKAGSVLTASMGMWAHRAHPNKGLPPPSPRRVHPKSLNTCMSRFWIPHAAFKVRCRQDPQAAGSGFSPSPHELLEQLGMGPALGQCPLDPSAHSSLKQAKQRPLHSGQDREARGLRGTRSYLPSRKTSLTLSG